MAKLRSKNKTTRGQGKRSLKKKAAAGKKGGDATADLGKHKGHKTKKGLAQDQKKVSKEKHEKHFQKAKKKKNLKSSSKAVTDQEIIDKFKLKGSDAIRVKNGKTKNK